jgi:hypothetical protein
MQLASQSLEQLAEDARIARELADAVNDPTGDMSCAAVARLNEMVRRYNAECVRLGEVWDARIAALGVPHV